MRHGKWDGLRRPASVLERDLCSGDSAFCRGDGGPGSTARPDCLAGMNGFLTDGRLRIIYASALPAGDGCALNPIPSRSLGTSSPQLEPPRALPSREEQGLVTKYALKGCKPGGGLSEGVLGKLGPGEEAAPAVLVVRAV